MTQAQVILPLPALRDSNSSDEEDEEEVNEPESLPDHNFDIKKSVWKSGPKKRRGEGPGVSDHRKPHIQAKTGEKRACYFHL